MPTPPSPLTAASDLVSFAATVNGAALDASLPVVSLRVVQAANQISSARVTVLGGSFADENFLATVAAIFKPGNVVGLGAGYHGQNQSLFTGPITRIAVRQQAGAALVIVVDCHAAAGAGSHKIAATPRDPTRPPVLSVTYGNDLLACDLAEEAPGKIRGTLLFQGSALVHPGDTIAIGGLGPSFNGNAWVGGVTHTIEDGLWRTEATVGGAPAAPAATPGKNSLALSDDSKSVVFADQNGNSIKLAADGITLTSAAAITLTAAQNIVIKTAAGTVAINGTQGVNVAGLAVKLSADTEFSAMGNASAELTSSGQTKVQGAMVMIN